MTFLFFCKCSIIVKRKEYYRIQFWDEIIIINHIYLYFCRIQDFLLIKIGGLTRIKIKINNNYKIHIGLQNKPSLLPRL